MWILFAFAAAFFAGLTAVLAKVGVRETDSDLATAIRTVVVLLFAWLLVLFESAAASALRGILTVSVRSLLFLILSGLATGASWLFYFRALQMGDVNQVAPIDKSSVVLTMLLSFLVLREPLHANMVVGMAAILAGMLLMIRREKGAGAKTHNMAWLPYALLSAFFASLTTILAKIGVADISSNLATAIRTTVVLLFAWYLVFRRGKQREMRNIDWKSWAFLLLSGLATGLSWLCYYKALKDGRASIVAPIDKLSILVTVLFARVYLHERLSRKAAVGLPLLVGGIMTLFVEF